MKSRKNSHLQDAGEIDPYTMEDPIDRKMVAFDQTFDENVARSDPALSRYDSKTDTMRDIHVSDCLRKSLILQKLGKKCHARSVGPRISKITMETR